ncbi:MAG: L,D-transpeptidase [Pegethrix bostrychoides GSE-TBD4-15B]|uniref:L,D-transpeptidase n=1 Tax=Pegethrix bostrychoides GSE-TBD4-15B TaxID=2839662 RepID=A0A951PFW4_9CYAN|nr:L,D-transpeptidase [Pegethrix bostrychoides GSE-TBD4-15B]
MRSLVAKPVVTAVPASPTPLTPIPLAPLPTATASALNPPPAAPIATQAVQPGLDQILSNSLHPVALIHQTQLVIDLSDRQLLLYQDGRLHSRFEIAVGKAGWETPAGSFNVISMSKDPVWQNPITREVVTDPAKNPLGSRWIGFWTDGTHQIGLHGTNETELIGQAVSHGCVRMHDSDVQALFEQVAIGTPVLVQP